MSLTDPNVWVIRASLDNFYSIVEAYCFENPDRVFELARQFEIAPSTVMHWIREQGNPHPVLQKQVVEYIFGRME